MIDFKKIGDAALQAAESASGLIGPMPAKWDESPKAIAAGKAAVAAMIPAAQENGMCNPECPFFYYDTVDNELSFRCCTERLSKLDCPGPDCPAKEAQR